MVTYADILERSEKGSVRFGDNSMGGMQEKKSDVQALRFLGAKVNSPEGV